MLTIRTPFALFCIAVVAFAPLMAAAGAELCAVLVPLWLGGPDGRVIVILREPSAPPEQLVPLVSVTSPRAPPAVLAQA